MQDGMAESETRRFMDVLPSADAAALREQGRRRTFPKGTTIFNEGESSDRVVIVLEGRVKISYFTEDGKEVVLAVRGAGEILGDMSAIDGRPRSATGTTLEQTECIVLTVDDFKDFLSSKPGAGFAYIELLVDRLRDSDLKRIEFSAYDSAGRLARRLLELAERFGERTDSGTRINLPLSQEELAGWTGSSREAVAKALQTFRSRGWIETGRRSITILDEEELARRAD
jgi:CRP-like cAMP-binding protein